VAELDLAKLYARHRQGLFTAALSITGCAAQAEDAIHDAFARMCRSTPAEIIDPPAYIFTAVRRAAIGQRRRAGPPASDTGAAIFAIETGSADAHAIDVERQRSVADAIGKLPWDMREVVVLRVYAGLSFAQIAAVVNEPLPTVASRYRRSLDRLRQRLEHLV
jgi:RNA polymerase sigma-70 factor (ECF subfamily)